MSKRNRNVQQVPWSQRENGKKNPKTNQKLSKLSLAVSEDCENVKGLTYVVMR